MFALMKSQMSSKKGHVRSKTWSQGQITEELIFVTKGSGFKSLLFNAIPHNPQGSDELLEGHHGPLVTLYQAPHSGALAPACGARILYFEELNVTQRLIG